MWRVQYRAQWELKFAAAGVAAQERMLTDASVSKAVEAADVPSATPDAPVGGALAAVALGNVRRAGKLDSKKRSRDGAPSEGLQLSAEAQSMLAGLSSGGFVVDLGALHAPAPAPAPASNAANEDGGESGPEAASAVVDTDADVVPLAVHHAAPAADGDGDDFSGLTPFETAAEGESALPAGVSAVDSTDLDAEVDALLAE